MAITCSYLRKGNAYQLTIRKPTNCNQQTTLCKKGVTNDNFDRERGKLNIVNNVLERVEAVKTTGIADKTIIEDYFGQKKEFEVTETTVNAVVPGIVETPWQKEKPEEIKQNIYNKTAIHRFATIDEIVETYRFCIDNPFVNGSLIETNGGYSYK